MVSLWGKVISRIATKIVPELSSLPYESKLGEMDLLTIEDRRGDLIALYKFTSRLDKLDRSNLVMNEGRKGLRRHSKKLIKGTCLKDKKVQFPI